MTAMTLPTPKPLRAIGEYEILAEIARGGMGSVYLARRTGEAGFERHFAIKVMHHNLSDDRDATLMLLDEAHIASRMHHPNIVSVLDIGVYDEGYYLVMDYVEGCSLDQLMRRNKTQRPPRLIVPIFLDTLHGLHAVHTLRDANGEPYNVVHRDISPQNLLVGLDGGCRVTDFGIAKAAARFTDTRTGTSKGKLSYMAPEQILGAKELDLRADLWAVGVTLYYALTGVHPFKGESEPNTMHNIMSVDAPPPSTVGLKPPACFDDHVLKLLRREPDERHASAHEVGDELRRLALADDLLGAPSEIAEWVDSSFGTELAARRQRLGELHAREGPLDSQESLPRLWLGTGPGSSQSGHPIRTIDGDAQTRTETTADLIPTPRARQRRRIALAILLLGAALAGAAALSMWGPDEEDVRVEHDPVQDSADVAVTPTEPPPTEPAEVPEEVPEGPASEEPPAELADSPAPAGEASAPVTGRRRSATTISERRRGRRGDRGQNRRSSSTTEAPASESTASSSTTTPATESSPPPRRRLEHNPYLRRE